MANPDVGDLHVNSLLSQVSVGWNPAGFYATRVFPVVNVDKQSDYYAKYDRSHWFRDLGAAGAAPTGSANSIIRAPGTKARTVGFTVDNTSTYFTRNFALGAEIPKELRANADAQFDLDRDFLKLINSLMLLRFDRYFTATYLTTSVWTDQSLSNKWSDYAASTPVEDMRTANDTLRQKTGGMSETAAGKKLILGTLVRRRLLDHPDIIARVQYGNSAGNPTRITDAILASLFEVDEIITPTSMYTENEEGLAEASVTYADVLSDDALLVWAPDATRVAPVAGILFNWRSAATGGLTYVRRGTDDRTQVDWIEQHAYLDWVKATAGAGVYIDDAVD